MSMRLPTAPRPRSTSPPPSNLAGSMLQSLLPTRLCLLLEAFSAFGVPGLPLALRPLMKRKPKALSKPKSTSTHSTKEP